MSVRTGIALGGFMGVGKSSVGIAVADRLALPFVDTDLQLIEGWGPIARQFARDGESCFRERERAIVLELCDGRSRVVSTGGGVWADDALRQALRRSYRTVVLTASLETIRKRIRDDDSRPLSGHLERLFRSRERAYRQADLVVDTTRLSVSEVVDEVVAWAQAC